MNTALKTVLLDTALRAGALIEHLKKNGTSTQTKQDGSPVTEADRQAEELIADTLRAVFPSVGFVGEESLAAGIPPILGERFFLVDPLDGTREFIRGTKDYTVNIGLIEQNRPIAGVVYAPARQALYLAVDGVTEKFAISSEFSPQASVILRCNPVPPRPRVVTSRFHMTSATARYIEAQQLESVRQVGSSLKFCLVAEGTADIYPRFGKTMEWDTAAGEAVLAGAGGVTLDLQGKPLRYGNVASREKDFLNPAFMARGCDEVV